MTFGAGYEMPAARLSLTGGRSAPLRPSVVETFSTSSESFRHQFAPVAVLVLCAASGCQTRSNHVPRSAEGFYTLTVDIIHGLVLCERVEKVTVVGDLAPVRVLDYGQGSRQARHSDGSPG